VCRLRSFPDLSPANIKQWLTENTGHEFVGHEINGNAGQETAKHEFAGYKNAIT